MRSLIAEIAGGFAAMHPRTFPYAKFALALSLALVGGFLFQKAALPLPWMLGPITACTIAALAGLPVAAPSVVRPPMTIVIGVLLGSSFSPALIGQLPLWIGSIAGLIAFIVVAGGACTYYFRKVAGFDAPTAYFAGMPGGLVEMVILGEERGGDARMIALVHSARVMLVVMTLPFVVQAIEGVTIGARGLPGPSILSASLGADLWLLACFVGGVLLAHWWRIPGRLLIAPMLLTAVVHVAGLTDFVPPYEVIFVAQVVLGTMIGCRFAGGDRALVLRTLMMSVGATIVLLIVTALFAFVLSRLTGLSPVLLLLAYSPGGLAEMGLLAMVLHLDAAFVAAHHVLRIMTVIMAAGPAFGLIARWGPRAE